jgi:hypothetical protein
MKFSEITEEQWDELGPFLDTCLLPVTGLDGTEKPWEAADSLEQLQFVLDELEIPYKGRIVTYPAYHYTGFNEDTASSLEHISRHLKNSAGFRFVLLVSAKPELKTLRVPSADLLITAADIEKEGSGRIRSSVESLWRQNDA